MDKLTALASRCSAEALARSNNMNTHRMAQIIKENYMLSELEERLELMPKDFESGIEDFIDDNYDEVIEMLREDLWFD